MSNYGKVLKRDTYTVVDETVVYDNIWEFYYDILPRTKNGWMIRDDPTKHDEYGRHIAVWTKTILILSEEGNSQ